MIDRSTINEWVWFIAVTERARPLQVHNYLHNYYTVPDKESITAFQHINALHTSKTCVVRLAWYKKRCLQCHSYRSH